MVEICTDLYFGHERVAQYAHLPVVRAYIGPRQLLVSWTCRTTAVLRVAEQFLLTRIAVRILLVAPLAGEVQPSCGTGSIVSSEGLRVGRVAVKVCAQNRIPQLAAVREVCQDTSVVAVQVGDRVVVGAVNGVVGM